MTDDSRETLVLGDVRHVHLDESVTLEDRIDVSEVDAVGRLAGSLYTRTDDRFALERPP
ncbi:hypothetical protein [Natronorubrum sediminis]|uniref:hypothetical protein n=1 Tax=Natronorubrum sediminis TaxID=640943 RepID=UPI001FE08AE9|nr:hypothetical protein [Natronorubrum sediminis]